MTIASILVANRGEIAIRIIRAAADLGLRTVAVHPPDDADSLHVAMADEAVVLEGRGVRAYLDVEGVVGAAVASGCDALHPGYGFLSEQPQLARRCAEAGVTFIGPRIEHLELFGDKGRAREVAAAAGVPITAGIDRAVSFDEAAGFLASLGAGAAMVIKALHGGGGRGTRVVNDVAEVEAAYDRCRSEARAAFGSPDVYVEEFLPRARHVEVQVLGDLSGAVTHLGERECSIQRRFQKVIEIAPAPGLPAETRDAVIEAAVRLAARVGYSSLGTFEFLIEAPGGRDPGRFVFMEANPRLQVEHTVTEAVTGVDLVQTQIRLAAGASLAELGLDDPARHEPRGVAIQARVNMETVEPDGGVRPNAGVLRIYEPPGGPGIRVDGFGYAGYRTSTLFDPLLAKVIAHAPGDHPADAVGRTIRALREFRIDGVETNLAFLVNVLAHPDLARGDVHTRWVDEHLAELATGDPGPPRTVRAAAVQPGDGPGGRSGGMAPSSRDPLALFDHDARVKAERSDGGAGGADDQPTLDGPDGSVGVPSPIQGTVVSIDVAVGDAVAKGRQVAVVEAMKLEHTILADRSGVVQSISTTPGDVVFAGHPVVFISEADVDADEQVAEAAVDLDEIRPDLAEVIARHGYTLDENRPEAVTKRHALGYRTVRENIDDLVDPGSFKEYWPLIVARQHQRHDIESLRRRTPADGLVAGIGTINADLFGDEASRAMVVSYDYTVLAGTQGNRNHYKQDRMFELANRFRLPVVLFGEGGGGRPGDDDTGPRVAFDTHTFTQFSKLSGLVPLVAIANGRTFAGNTALVAACDVIIATEGSTLAMGGPAMIEGGGLGIYTPEEVGPMSFQVPNGVVDILVEDEEAAVRVAKQYLSYFQGAVGQWEEPDQRRLRHVIPENRLRLYDMRQIISTIADVGSVLEIREEFGVGVITAFIRVEGRPMGVIANNPHHLAGAIDSDGADKGARFLQLCDAFDIPVLSLMDCPGIMVGPDHERTALVRHALRMFNAGANLTVPLFGVVVRKAYGLGVQAMCGASSLVGFFTVAWPTAEFAGMNLEGSVKLGFRKELAAIDDPEQRREEFDRRVRAAYEAAKAVNAAAGGGLDDVIDPADTRDWIASSLRRLPPTPPRSEKKYPYIDTW